MPSTLLPSFAPSNLRFCERPLDGLVTEPANTWTNVGFLVVGLWIVVAARREGARRAGWLGPIALATCVASAAFHATSTFAAQALDQGVMLLESALFITLDVGRLRPGPGRRLVPLYVAIVAPSIALLVAFRTWGIGLFALHVVLFLSLELRLALRDFRRTRYGPLLGAFATFASSYALWWLDRLGVLCDPDNHVFTAHGAWHLLGALSFYFWYRHYAQFEGSR